MGSSVEQSLLSEELRDEQSSSVPQPNIRANIIILVIIFLVIIIGSVFGYYSVRSKQYQGFHDAQKHVATPTLTPTIMPINATIKPSVTASPVKTHWTLFRQSAGEKIDIVSFYDEEQVYIFRNNDTIYFPHKNNRKELIIAQHNIQDGDTNFSTNLLSKLPERSEIFDMLMIGNVLYLGTGGHMTRGSIYSINLDLPDTTDLFVELQNGAVSFLSFADKHYVSQAQGDFCWAYANYYHMDTVTNTLNKVAETTRGCTEGEEIIGLIEPDTVILAYHTSDERVNGDNPSAPQFLYVAIRPFDKPDALEYLIPESAMPQNVSDVFYYSATNTLILNGESLYTFSLDDKQLKEVAVIPKEWRESDIEHVNETMVCIDPYGRRETVGVIYLNQKIFKEEAHQCEEVTRAELFWLSRSRTADQVLEKLSLPGEYSLELVTEEID